MSGSEEEDPVGWISPEELVNNLQDVDLHYLTSIKNKPKIAEVKNSCHLIEAKSSYTKC